MVMCDSKSCFKCGVHKPLSEFYKHKMMADGHLNKCKDCTRKDVKQNRSENLDYYKEYDKQRANNPERVLGREIYSQSEAGKQSQREAKKRWIEGNLIKRAAHIIFRNRVRSNPELIKHECESCGVGGIRLNAHHDDYSKPLLVRFLCGKCHSKWHKEHGSGLNG